ncbi:MAG: Glycosyltransferase [Parcubacteria group bacterium Gr01-1014_29]|nr:MAG: Glycosyltransferase [Parcubacteria group bacterium Gr01-1014_29]
MRIIIATGIFPPDIGGPATYSKTIAEEFSKRGHQVCVITYGDTAISNFKFQISNFRIKKVSRKIPKGLRHLVYFSHVMRLALHADIVYAQDAVSAGFPAALAALLLGKRFFLKVVGDHAWEQASQRFGVADLLDDFLAKRYGFRVRVLRAAERFAARRAERIIVPSEYLKSVVERWGISPTKIIVIPNAVFVADNVPTKDEARRILNLGGFVLLTVGRLVPWKGFQMLIELMPRLIQKIPDVKLVIVGTGPEEKNLQLTTYNLQLPVVFTGAVSKEKLLQHLAAADIFLLNTGYEGFSHQLIEAMAAGVPVITTNAGGNREVVRDGENALIARYNDREDWERKIISLYKDKNLQLRLKKPNRDIIQTYSVKAMITKTESIILNS